MPATPSPSGDDIPPSYESHPGRNLLKISVEQILLKSYQAIQFLQGKSAAVEALAIAAWSFRGQAHLIGMCRDYVGIDQSLETTFTSSKLERVSQRRSLDG